MGSKPSSFATHTFKCKKAAEMWLCGWTTKEEDDTQVTQQLILTPGGNTEGTFRWFSELKEKAKFLYQISSSLTLPWKTQTHTHTCVFFYRGAALIVSQLQLVTQQLVDKVSCIN